MIASSPAYRYTWEVELSTKIKKIFLHTVCNTSVSIFTKLLKDGSYACYYCCMLSITLLSKTVGPVVCNS